MGKLEVQIKKMPDNSTKMQCPMSLYAYSEITGNPVIFIAVEINQKLAYWQHISSKNLPQPIVKMVQDSITIHFSPENIIDGKNRHHVFEWKNVVESNLDRLNLFEKYRGIIENSNTIMGASKKEFTNIHYFLDFINKFFDNQFRIVKETFYPSAWKIGLAYSEFEKNSINYSLFPIPIDKNDVQIKKVDENLKERLKNEGLSWRGYYQENPILESPRKHAIDIVEEKTLRLLEQKALNLKGNDFLAREFIFAFIDEFHEPMGLSKKDLYTIAEIEAGFYHLPIWTIEAINFLVSAKRNNICSPKDALYHRPYFDPQMLLVQIMDNERKQIKASVNQKIARNFPVPIIPIGNDKYPFRAFFNILTYLRESKIDSVQRVYVPPDFSRLKNGRGWVWELYSDEAFDKNLQIFFENLPAAYNDIVAQNFPKINLPIFGNTNLEIVLYRDREKVENTREWPVEFFNLRKDNDNKFKLKFKKRDNAPEYSELSFKTIDHNKKIMLNGESYKCTGGAASGFDFIYEDLPMLSYIYKLLENNLKEYFNQKRKRLEKDRLF